MQPAPAPFAGSLAKARPDRVRGHVPADRPELRLGGDAAHREPVAEEVAGAAEAKVEPLRMAEEKPVHAPRERRGGRLHHEVQMVREEAEREHLPLVARGGVLQVPEESQPVVVVDDDGTPLDAARGDVEEAVSCRSNATRDAGHPPSVGPAPPLDPICA